MACCKIVFEAIVQKTDALEGLYSSRFFRFRFGAVWNEYCRRCGVPEDGQWFGTVKAYEAQILKKRG